jgi:NAD-dependent deacetylase
MTSPSDIEIARRLHGRVLVVTGAGVSAESGIPTFRGAEGYWRSHDPTQLATAEAFHRDPLLVWTWYEERRALIRAAEPNPAHRAIADLARISSDHLLVTQNVDDLHERAGSPPDRLVHIHGEIFVTRCTQCDYSTRSPVAGVPPPACPRCGSLLRPDVVWFDEELAPSAVRRIEGFLDRPLDLVLAVGTTATFDYILDWMTRSGTLVEINPAETSATARAERAMRGRAGEILPPLVAQAARFSV